MREEDIFEWTYQVKEIYNSFYKRNDVEAWKDVLNIENQDKDIYMYKLFYIFMDEKYIQSDVIKFIDSKFDLMENRQKLYEEFPEEYVNSILIKMNQKEYPSYEFFKIENNKDYDKFIELFFKIDRAFNTDRIKYTKPLFQEIRALGIEHPEVDLMEFVFYMNSRNPFNLKKAQKIMSKVEIMYKNSKYDNLLKGLFCLRRKKYKKAINYCKEVLKEDQYNFWALKGLVISYIEEYEFLNAKNTIYYALDTRVSEVDHKFFIENIMRANSYLLADLQKSIKKNDDNISKLELAFLYIEAQEFNNCRDILDTININEDVKIVFYAINSILYLDTNELEKSLEYIDKWEEELKTLDSTTKERLKSNFGYKLGTLLDYNKVIFIKSTVYSKLNKKQEAAELIDNSSDDNYLLLIKLKLLYEIEHYEDIISLCNDISIKRGDTSVYFYKIEALCKLNKLFDASKECDQLLKQYYNVLDFYICKIKILIDLNDLDEAEKMLDSLERKGILDFNVLYLKFLILSNKGEVEKAEKLKMTLKKQFKRKQDEIHEFILDDVLNLLEINCK